jgi:hypothetical protein
MKSQASFSMDRDDDTATKEDRLKQQTLDDAAGANDARSIRSHVLRWMAEDWPYIVMLLLAVMGVAFQLPAIYWIFVMPVYAVICIAAGWRHFATPEAHRELIYVQTLNWLAFIAAIYVLYTAGVQGVLNSNSSGLVMLTLLALGTFMAGLQARVWRICGLGALLFLGVPAIGWLEQSSMLLVGATVAIIAIGGLTWWLSQPRDRAVQK